MTIYFYHFKDIEKPICIVADNIIHADKIIGNALIDKKHSVNASIVTIGYRFEFIDLSKQKTIWLKSSKDQNKISYPHQFESIPISRGAVKTTYQCDSGFDVDRCIKKHSKPFDLIAVYTGNKFMGSKRTIRDMIDYLIANEISGTQYKSGI